MAQIEHIEVTISVTQEEYDWIRKHLNVFWLQDEMAFEYSSLRVCSAGRPNHGFWFLEGQLDKIGADIVICYVGGDSNDKESIDKHQNNFYRGLIDYTSKINEELPHGKR